MQVLIFIVFDFAEGSDSLWEIIHINLHRVIMEDCQKEYLENTNYFVYIKVKVKNHYVKANKQSLVTKYIIVELCYKNI